LTVIPFQIYSQSKANLEAINVVWNKFYQAFENLDYTLMAEIHSKDLVRVSGGQRILDYQTYIDNYKARFQNSKENNNTNNISLRFFERINNDDTASERGIYKLVINKGKKNEKSYYGQFHVIFKKENGTWKITMDYDSNYENKIGEIDFMESYGIENLKRFSKK